MNKKLIVIGLSVLMTLSVLSGISGLSNASSPSIDNYNVFYVNYKSLNFSLNNIYMDNFSAPTNDKSGGFFVNAQSFDGIYYVNDSSSPLKLSTYNFMTGKTSEIITFPSLTYDYLDYTGVNYELMPYYNQTNILNWLISYGDNSTTGDMNYWAYNILNGTTVDMNLSYAVSSSANYQINYLGKGIMMATNSTGDYDLYNIYTHDKIGSGSIDYMETNNFYYVPIYHLLVDVEAAGGTGDNVAFYNFNYTTSAFSLISDIQYSTSAIAINGVVDAVVNTTNKEIYVEPQGSSKFQVIYQYVNNTTVNLKYAEVLATTTVTFNGISHSPAFYQSGNGYIPLVSKNPYYSGGVGDGLTDALAFNPFSNLSANNTIYYPMYVNFLWGSVPVYNGYPSLALSLGNLNNDYNYLAFYNYSANSIMYLYNSSMPENYSTLLQPTNHYNLEIKENGLPSGTSWSYIFNGTSYSLTNNSYNYSLVNGNYALSVSSVNGYTVTYPSTITIDNASKIAYVNFTAIPKYSVTIQENGLPTNTQWNFTIKHSGTTVIAETLTTSSYTTSLQNDTYDLYAGSISGFNMHIHTSPFTVSGSAITEYINYTAIPTYTLFLKETGLASGTSWIAYVGSTQYTSSNAYINVTGLTNDTYSLSIDNVADYSLGSYPTSFTVSGSNYYINITFTHNTTLYQVKFIANHIANVNAITWTIVFNGTQYASKNSNTIIVPSLKNGSYSLVVNSVSGYITDKYPSTISISGSNITQELYFNETFSFQVNETGYSGQWFIIFNGTSYSSSTSTLIISGLVNYSYPLSVTTPTGYSVSSYPNIIKINGNNEYLNIIFTKTIITKGYFIVEFVIAGYRGNMSIIINNVIYYTTNGYKNVTLPNGTYNPVIELPSGYELAQPLPNLNVNGNNTVYPIYVKSYIDWQRYEPIMIIGLLFLAVLIIPAVVRAGRR
jgi:hypothetical protein